MVMKFLMGKFELENVEVLAAKKQQLFVKSENKIMKSSHKIERSKNLSYCIN